MIKIVLFVALLVFTLFIFLMFLVARFAPNVDVFLSDQRKLECKPCICHPDCHYGTKGIQQQIMKECNFSVDSHNALALHHTKQNQTTRFILVFSLSINFILILFLVVWKTTSDRS